MEIEKGTKIFAKKRKPNFSHRERLHIAQSYVENVEEYNRGYTHATKGDARHGRQRLLKRWASELTAFGIAQRTTVEVEQRIRDYFKKLAKYEKRGQFRGRELSPAAELMRKALYRNVGANGEDSTPSPSVSNAHAHENRCRETEYADFLLNQHRSTDSNDTSPDQSCEDAHNGQTQQTVINMVAQLDGSSDFQRILLELQVQNMQADNTLKNIAIENAKLDHELKLIELERRKFELQQLQREHELTIGRNGTSNTLCAD